ncbi:hypothetical protein NliqN6_4435 [Naganishia liquefaciens]|uniref:Protein CPL1-like domain-containing protein n=1 Tax=Naganishia liquefaciens TaxID=104408 RepID=A0A8H3TVU0_9TREE|nr:hypothetical protein NliqN6_4435 [Naganishia liquefaciens]
MSKWNGGCADVPARQVGETCSSSEVCVGAESLYEQPPFCGGTTPICGGAGTSCYGDGSGSGPDPVCASGQCFQFGCTAPTVSPGLKKRADLPAQHIVKQRLCPRGYEPCPVFGGGYECIDVLRDIESCGGCSGLGGIDCSADVHAVDVSCVSGHCVISACEYGFTVAAENNTCIAT